MGKVKAVTVFSWVEEKEIRVWHVVLTANNKLIHKIFFDIDPREIFISRADDKREIVFIKVRVRLYTVLEPVLLFLF